MRLTERMSTDAWQSELLDLEGYLRRLGVPARDPSRAALAELHEAHVRAFTFDNIDVLLGQHPGVSLSEIQQKFVGRGRGGYCFEQNTLLAAVLTEVGFQVDILLARVRRGAQRVLPRTHMVLQVHVGGQRWLADVGFGADGLLRPVLMEPPGEAEPGPWAHRLVREEPGLNVMQLLAGDTWCDLYAFTSEPQYAVDVEMSNHYVSTFPESRFVQTLTAQRITPDARYLLRNRLLTIDRGIDIETRELRSREEVLQVLEDVFRLPLPADAPLRTPE